VGVLTADLPGRLEVARSAIIEGADADPRPLLEHLVAE
jgi:hypothetical protein